MRYGTDSGGGIDGIVAENGTWSAQ
jgi:hypothetical protein